MPPRNSDDIAPSPENQTAQDPPRVYEVEIPSRDEMLGAVQAAGVPCTLGEIATRLGVEGKPALNGMRRRLKAMTRDGQLVHTRGHRFGLPREMELIRGRVLGHPDGFAFVRPDDGDPDIFIAQREARRVLHGDRVLVRIAGLDRRDRPYGNLVEILERANVEVVGRYFRESGVGFVVPDNRNINQEVLIRDDGLRARNGQIVVARIEQQPDEHRQPIGVISEVLGEHMGPGMEVDIAIRTHGLPVAWEEAVEAEVERIPQHVPAEAIEGRQDLRDSPFVTIDGSDARDFDDAVYCRKIRNGYVLYVAIADVAHYVPENSALDGAALERGTSVYFPDRVIPMLPEALSNGICSLNPDVDRLAMVCEMRFDDTGECVRHRFYNAVIRSHARLVYEDVAPWFGETTLPPKDSVKAHVRRLYELYLLLRNRREQRGALDIETAEPKFIFNAERKIERVESRERNDAHKLIEECMISANVAAARELEKYRQPALFRVHDTPDQERVEDLRKFLAELGLALGGGNEPTPRDFARVLEAARGREDRTLIETALLRSLKLAVYSAENTGHFGLGLDAYAHFTSPIRRYPDLVVHRALKRRIRRQRPPEGDFVSLAEHCSMTERRADEATRDAIAWLKCEYMLDKVGDTFEGIISGVTSFGVFVQLAQSFVEGLIHVTALPEDYYHFDPVRRSLEGRRSHREYRVGQPMRVTVTRVSLDDRQIDFAPAQTAEGGRKSGRKRRR